MPRSTVLLCSALGALAVSSPPTASAGPPPTVLVLPFEAPAGAHRDLGRGVEIKALGALRAMGAVNVVHPKMRAAVMRRHSTEDAAALARAVGASWTLRGTLAEAGGEMAVSLQLSPVATGEAKSGKSAGADWAAAIGGLPKALLTLVNAADGGKRAFAKPASPATNDPGALARLGTCYRMLDQQSVGITKPTLLDPVRVQQAANRCRAALRRAPGLVEAEAGLAMVEALEGQAEAAKARLTRIKGHSGFLPYYWIAKFWVLAKYYSPEQALAALEEAVTAQPGFMLGRGYLGEGRSALRAYADALKAFEAYLAQVPDQPFVMTRIGHEQAKLGRHADAVAITARALSLDPGNPETQLELGSRQIDAGQYTAAIEVLAKLAEDPKARGEVHLRLGFAYLRTKQVPKAEAAFRKALAAATAPADWRTRGRAHYDLAKTLVRQSKNDEAIAALGRAVDTGFAIPTKPALDADWTPLKDDARFTALLKRTAKPPEAAAQYESPFLLSRTEAAQDAAKDALKPGNRAAVTF